MKISDADKAYLLSLKPEDLTFEKLVELFGDKPAPNGDLTSVRKSRFETTDTFELTPKDYFVTSRMETTVGKFIFNKFLVERCGFEKITGYVNEEMTDGNFSKFERKLSDALIEDKITVDSFVKYINYRDFLGLQLNSVITTSFTPKSISAPKEILKKRDALFTKYDKQLQEGDIVTSEKIENELVKDAKEYLKNDPGMDLYNSEARGNFGNYKNMNLYKGATLDPQTGKFDIVRSSFMDGIRKEDIPSFGNSVVAGAYPKAVGTQESGYLSKQLLAAMQQEVIGDHGTDCGSKLCLTVELTSKNYDDYLYRYIVEGSKYVCLSPENRGNYVGKTVKLRSPMYCKGAHGATGNNCLCNICAGEMNYILNNQNIGLGTSRVSTALLQLGMKKFHIANLSSVQINVDDMLI